MTRVVIPDAGVVGAIAAVATGAVRSMATAAGLSPGGVAFQRDFDGISVFGRVQAIVVSGVDAIIVGCVDSIVVGRFEVVIVGVAYVERMNDVLLEYVIDQLERKHQGMRSGPVE